MVQTSIGLPSLYRGHKPRNYLGEPSSNSLGLLMFPSPSPQRAFLAPTVSLVSPPPALTEVSNPNHTIIPTVTDVSADLPTGDAILRYRQFLHCWNLVNEGTIPLALVAASFVPTTAIKSTHGSISFGAPDPKKYKGKHILRPAHHDFPTGQFVGYRTGFPCSRIYSHS